jgi:hypothetical protein
VTAGQTGDLIAEQDAILARVVGFIQEGMRANRISDESGEVLIAAAERQHDEAVSRIRMAGGYLA